MSTPEVTKKTLFPGSKFPARVSMVPMRGRAAPAISTPVTQRQKEQWRKRGLGMGTLMAADGRLIIMSAKGELIVAAATPDAYTERSRTTVLEGGVLYLRISQFTSGIARKTSGKIWERNSKAVILDLRHNQGGLINEGVAAPGTFARVELTETAGYDVVGRISEVAPRV